MASCEPRQPNEKPVGASGWPVISEGCGCCFTILLAPLFGLVATGVILLVW